jgi:hypothetical protein
MRKTPPGIRRMSARARVSGFVSTILQAILCSCDVSAIAETARLLRRDPALAARRHFRDRAETRPKSQRGALTTMYCTDDPAYCGWYHVEPHCGYVMPLMFTGTHDGGTE